MNRLVAILALGLMAGSTFRAAADDHAVSLVPSDWSTMPTLSEVELTTTAAFRERILGKEFDVAVTPQIIVWKRADGSYPPKIISEAEFKSLISGMMTSGWNFSYIFADGKAWKVRRWDLEDCKERDALRAARDPRAQYVGCKRASVLLRPSGEKLVEVELVENMALGLGPAPMSSVKAGQN